MVCNHFCRKTRLPLVGLVASLLRGTIGRLVFCGELCQNDFGSAPLSIDTQVTNVGWFMAEGFVCRPPDIAFLRLNKWDRGAKMLTLTATYFTLVDAPELLDDAVWGLAGAFCS
jgi:hypothetical protein